MNKIIITSLITISFIVSAKITYAGCEKGREVSTPDKFACMVEINGKELPDGLYKEMHPNGQKKVQGTYIKGLKTGKWVMWSKEGKKIEEINYDNDKKHGVHTTWHYNGKKAFEGKFENGKPVGTHYEWNDKDLMVSEKKYTQKDGDDLATRQVWWDNGKLKSKQNFKNGKSDGEYVEWHVNEQKKAEGKYVSGQRNGTWTFWKKDGTVDKTVKYNKGRVVK